MPSSPLPRQHKLVFRLTAISAAIGAVYSQTHVVENAQPLFAVYGMARGLVIGIVIGGVLSSLEVFGYAGALGSSLRRAPFPAHVAIKTVIYLAVVLFALKLGAWAFPTSGETGIETRDVLFSLAASFVFVFLLDVNTLLGQNVLFNFVTGRYYRPRLEERILLFVDMEGSTGLAERLGPLAFHRLLNRFVTDLTGPIVAARGEIYSYVGDELIATWTLAHGVADARCVSACFAALDELARRAPDYLREFGAAVNFRAGLHCGPVVTGEMGSVKKEIVFLGDAVNTAARIQEFCRETGDRILASADLIDRLELPPGIVKRSLGDLRLRGKGADLALCALTKAKEKASRAKAADSRESTRDEQRAALS
jgi:adenylate cyclase